MSNVLQRFVVASVTLFAAASPALLPSVASGANDRLACELAPLDVIQQTFSYRVTRVRRLHFAISPTARPPRDHTAGGGDLSVCNARAWKSGPYPGPQFQSIFGNYMLPEGKVPKGVGVLHVMTYVRDESQAGSNFNADEWYTETLSLAGTHRITVPSFGLTRAYGGWFFYKNQMALGMWQDGEDGVIEIEVYAHRDGVDSLRRAASLIVPNFNP